MITVIVIALALCAVVLFYTAVTQPQKNRRDNRSARLI